MEHVRSLSSESFAAKKMEFNGVGGSTKCDGNDSGSIQVTCFSDVSEDGVALHFQIIRLPKQIIYQSCTFCLLS